MLSAIGGTAQWVAALRALESERDDRLFLDPYARALAGEAGFAMVEAGNSRVGPAADLFNSAMAIRTRFLDDGVARAVASGIRQLVILAAGMDARVFRLHFPAGMRAWELDSPEMFAVKQAILEPMRPKTGCTRHVIGMDLRDDWTMPLAESGFDVRVPAAFLVEGLLVYLTAEDVDVFLGRLAKVAAVGSWLGCDVAGLSLLQSPMMASVHAALEAQGIPWRFGVDEPEAFFAERGWRAECLVNGDPGANFGRWPFPPADRDSDSPRSYYVSATRV